MNVLLVITLSILKNMPYMQVGRVALFLNGMVRLTAFAQMISFLCDSMS